MSENWKMNFDEKVSNFITKLLSEETPRLKNEQYESTYIQRAEYQQNATHLNLKQKYQDLREKCEFYMQYIAHLTAELSDSKARRRLYEEQHENEVKTLRNNFAYSFYQLYEKLGAKIDELLKQNQQLAYSNEQMALQFRETKQQLATESTRQISQLQAELNGYKTRFDQKIDAERLKLQQQMRAHEEQRVAYLMKQREKLTNEQIEIQISKLQLAKENELHQAKIEWEKSKLLLYQQYQQYLKEEVEKERKTIIQQQISENQQLLEQNKQAALRQVENAENALKQQIQQMRAEFELRAAGESRSQNIKMYALAASKDQEIAGLRGEIEALHRAAQKLGDDFTFAKSYLEQRYSAEIQLIRSNYREFAVNVFKNEKNKLLAGVQAEMRRQMQDLAATIQHELDVEKEGEIKAVIREKEALQEQNALLANKLSAAEEQLAEARRAVEKADRLAKLYESALMRLESAKTEDYQRFAEHSRARYEQIRMIREELQSSRYITIIQYNRKDEQAFAKIKVQIQQIIDEKDAKFAELRLCNEKLAQDIARYYRIISELEQV